MKLLLLPLLSAISLPASVNAEISDQLHKRCLDARDYAGCVRTNNKLSPKKRRKCQGLE